MIEILLTLFLLNWKGAKGLLSLMLSLPDDWNYNMQGLETLSRDVLFVILDAIFQN